MPCQVYKGCWCTAPVLLSNVNLVHDGAQMHRYFYQFIRKKVITMWRQVTPSLRYSTSQQPNFGPRTALDTTVEYHIPYCGFGRTQQWLTSYIRGAEPIKQLHVPRAAKRCQTGNGNQISTISTLRYAVILPSWPPFLYTIFIDKSNEALDQNTMCGCLKLTCYIKMSFQ